MPSKWLSTSLALSAWALSACMPKPIPTQPGDPGYGVQLTWHGHSSFTLKDSAERTVVIDPFDDTVGYGRLFLRADALLITHEHFDHNDKKAVRPKGRDLDLINSTGTISFAGGLSVNGILSDHDKQNGEINGKNRIYSFIMGGMRFVHLGDLGQSTLTDIQKASLGQTDVLFVPVGGTVTLDAAEAKAVVNQLKPRYVFPMHYGDKRFYKLAPVEDFLALFPPAQVVKINGSTVQLKISDAGTDPRIYVLTPNPRN